MKLVGASDEVRARREREVGRSQLALAGFAFPVDVPAQVARGRVAADCARAACARRPARNPPPCRSARLRRSRTTRAARPCRCRPGQAAESIPATARCRRSRAAHRSVRARRASPCSDASVTSPRKSSGEARSAGGVPTRPKRWWPKLCSRRNCTWSSTSCGAWRSSSVHVTSASETTMLGCRSSHSVTRESSPCCSGSNSMPATCKRPLRVAANRQLRPVDGQLLQAKIQERQRRPRHDEIDSREVEHRLVGGASAVADLQPADRQLRIPAIPAGVDRRDRDRLPQRGRQRRHDAVAVVVDPREQDEADDQQQHAEHRERCDRRGAQQAEESGRRAGWTRENRRMMSRRQA